MNQSITKGPEPIKVDDKFVEHAPDVYQGLMPEDADFMRGYEGKAGKKVVSKVGLHSTQLIVFTYHARLIFDCFQSWLFCTYSHTSIEEILATPRLREWTRISALLGISITSRVPSSSFPTSSSVGISSGLIFPAVLTYDRGSLQHHPQAGSRKRLAVIPRSRLGNYHDLHGCRQELPRSFGLQSHSWSIRGLLSDLSPYGQLTEL